MPKYSSKLGADVQKVKISYSSYSGEACLDPRVGKSNIGPGPVTPPGAPGPESKGSIKVPEQL
jgi:hypothetical protein